MQRARAIVLIALATSVIAPGGEIGDAASQTNEADESIFSGREAGFATLNAAGKAVSEAEEKAASEVAIAAAVRAARDFQCRACPQRQC